MREKPMREASMTDEADAKARATAHGLIQGYIGPDHKVLKDESMTPLNVSNLQELLGAR
jgi:hypothetical protein